MGVIVTKVAKVIATVTSNEGSRFNLHRTHMQGISRDPVTNPNVLRCTKQQVRRAFAVTTKVRPGRGEDLSGKYVWALVRYTVTHVTQGGEINRSTAYARAYKTNKVVIGCQRFSGKDARVLREWATA